MVSKSFLTITLLVLCLLAQGQPTRGISASTPLSNCVARQWTGENGIIANNLTSVLQSSAGFLWITSYVGAIRFDGIRADVYDHLTLPFLSTDSFYALYEDKEGTLWFATQGSGILTYKNQKFEPLLPNNKILPKSIRCLKLNQDGSIWAGSNNHGLFLIRDTVVTQISHPALNEVSILGLDEDHFGNLWIATEGNGVIRKNGNTYVQYTTANGLISNTITSILCSPTEEVYIGTSQGLNVLSNNKLSVITFLKDLQINYMKQDSEGTVWLGTEQGLGRYNKAMKLEEFVRYSGKISLTRINSICFDHEGSVWLSTGKSGLVRLTESNFDNYTANEGLSSERINVVYEAGSKMFIGSDDGTVDVIENGKIRSFPISTSLNGYGIRDMYLDKSNALWISSYAGILKKSDSQEKLFTTKDGLPALDVRRMLKDSNGNFWIATRSGGVAKMTDEKVTAVYDKKHGITSNYILSLEEDRKGNILVGTHSGGLIKITKDGKLETYHMKDDDSGILIFNTYIDEDNAVWVVAIHGLFYFDGKKFIQIILNPAQRGENYFDWVEDTKGNVWVTSNVGIVRLNKNEVKDFIHGKSGFVRARRYDNNDGILNKESAGATQALLARDEKIWIPAIGGITVIRSSQTNENKLPPPVYITNFSVDTAGNHLPNNVKIKPGHFRYAFEFTALSFLASQKNKFSYKLEGIDKDWTTPDHQREAEYTNLPPGKYTFFVRGSNNDDVWNTTQASLTFTVLPFFYQTFMFYVLLALSLAILLYSIYRWRVRTIEKANLQLKKVNAELDKFVYSASHDLRAPLSSILGIINISRIDPSADRKEEYLGLIEKSIRKLDTFIKEIIDFSRNARTEVAVVEIPFDKLIREIVDNLKYLDEHSRIERIVEVDTSNSFFTDDKRLAMVLTNLVANAFRYSNTKMENPFIAVRVKADAFQAVLKVSDNGTGIAPEHIKNIFKMFYRGTESSSGSGLGLYIACEALEKINGKISVTSKVGEGSTFEVVIPNLKLNSNG